MKHLSRESLKELIRACIEDRKAFEELWANRKIGEAVILLEMGTEITHEVVMLVTELYKKGDDDFRSLYREYFDVVRGIPHTHRY